MAWEFLLSIWSFFQAFLGGSINENIDKNNYFSTRLVIFIYSMMGTIFWISYGAYLTRDLAVPVEHVPFSSLEEFLETDYKLNFRTKLSSSTRSLDCAICQKGKLKLKELCGD